MDAGKSILERLYNGELCPAEQVVPQDPDYLPTWEAILEKLEQMAQPEEVDRLDALIGNIAVMNARAGFTQGFRLGAALAKELGA